MNIEDMFTLKQNLLKDLCKNSFHFFVKQFWKIADGTNFVDNWHLKMMCDTLQAVYNGDIQHVYIAVPPGSGKSMIVSVLYPVWCWVNDPTKSFLSTGHTMSLNQKFCTKSLRFLMSPEFTNVFDYIEIDPKEKAKAHYRNLEGGFREAASFTSLTGKRANYVLVDDPITVNNAKTSRTEREAVNDIFLNALQSRLNDPEKDHIIVIAQRTHVEDIIGIIKEKNMNYEGIVIPMEYTGSKVINEKLHFIDPRNDMGELMFPKRFSQMIVDNMKKTMLKTDYATQNQQSPTATDGNFFDITKLKTYSTLPSKMNVYISTDNAITGNGDYNAITVWGIDTKNDYYLIDFFHEKCQLLDALGIKDNKLSTKGLLPFIKKYKPVCVFPENDNAYKSIEPIIKQKMIEHKTISKMNPLSTSGSKVAKAQGFQLAIEQGRVYIPSFLSNDIVDQMNTFPISKHDDFVDSCSNFFRAGDTYKAVISKPEETPNYDYYGQNEDDNDSYSLYS